MMVGECNAGEELNKCTGGGSQWGVLPAQDLEYIHLKYFWQRQTTDILKNFEGALCILLSYVVLFLDLSVALSCQGRSIAGGGGACMIGKSLSQEFFFFGPEA